MADIEIISDWIKKADEDFYNIPSFHHSIIPSLS